jgi:hypothetical protein
LDRGAAEAVHRSVLATCGPQAGVDEGLVTDPASCGSRPEQIACRTTAAGDPGCLTPNQVDAIERLMNPVVNSKGEVIYSYADIPGTATEWGGWHMGGRAQTQDFFRLFLIPGVHHCTGGPGLADFDVFTLLEHWSKRDRAQPFDVSISAAGAVLGAGGSEAGVELRAVRSRTPLVAPPAHRRQDVAIQKSGFRRVR